LFCTDSGTMLKRFLNLNLYNVADDVLITTLYLNVHVNVALVSAALLP